MNRLIIQCCLLTLSLSSFAQNKIQLQATVINNYGDPLPFANVSVQNRTVGTITNQDGKFSMTLTGDYRNDTLRVSYVGYEPYLENLNVYLKNSIQRIILHEDVTNMSEIIVSEDKVPSAKVIIDQVRKNIKENYPAEPYMLKTFYRQSKMVNGEYVSLDEAAVDIFGKNHKPSNKQFTDEILVVNEFRKSNDFFDKKLDAMLDPPMKINPIKGVLLQNSVRYIKHNDVLLKEGYQLDSIVQWEGKEHYIITLPPPNSAKMYIDAESYALRRLENIRDYTHTQTPFDHIRQDSLKSKLQHLHYSIEFKEIGGKFYPFFMEFTVHALIENLNKQDTIYDRVLKQRLLVADVQTANVKLPSAKEQTENTIFGNLDLKYNSNFWDNYNIIELTPIEEKLLGDLQKDVSLREQFQTQYFDSAPKPKTILTSMELRTDFQKYRSIMEEVHTGLYNYLPPDEWDSLMDSLYHSLESPKRWDEFYEMIAYSITQVKNGHTEVDPPSWWKEKKRAIFPLTVQYLEGKVIVEKTLDPDLSIPKGSEIISINGLSTESIRKKIWPILSADGNIQTYKYRKLSLFYAKYLAIALEDPDEFVIEYLPPGKEMNEVKHSGLQTSIDSFEEYLMVEDINNNSDGNLKINQGKGYAWLNIYNSMNFIDSLGHYFMSIKDSGVQNLIIDIRRYWGLVEDCHSSKLYSYFVDRPFQFFDHLKVKSDNYDVFDEDFTYAPYATSLREIKEGYFDKLTPSGDGYFLWEDEPCIGMNNPGKYPFKGQVYILAGGLTFSANADFVSKMNQLDSVTIIGEETGGAKDGYVSGFQPRVVLPHSQLKIFVPTWQSSVCCSESQELNGRGVLPDHLVEQTIIDFIDNRDTVKEYVLNLVK